MSLFKKIKVVGEERLKFYEFTPGKHVLKFVEVLDKEKPFERKRGDKTEYIIRTVVEDENGKRYRYWIDVTKSWKDGELIVDKWRMDRDSQILRIAAERGSLEGLKLEFNVTAEKRRKRYTVRDVTSEAKLPEFKEVTAPPVTIPETPIETKPPKAILEIAPVESIKKGYEGLKRSKVPHEEAVKILSDMYKVPREEIEKIVKEVEVKEVTKEEYSEELRKVAENVYKTLRDYGPIPQEILKGYISSAHDLKSHSPDEVIEILVKAGKIKIEEGKVRAI